MTDKKILVVEDDPPNMELLVDLLQVNGYGVLQATTAEDGIKMAKSDSPDLIIMDINLPGMDGLEATKFLGQDPSTRNIPVVALSSFAMKGDDEKAFEAGCCDYITKPIDTKFFSNKVAECISIYSSDRE